MSDQEKKQSAVSDQQSDVDGKKRTITEAEFHQANEVLEKLAFLLEEVGVMIYRYKADGRTAFWDTEGGGLINPEALDQLDEGISEMFQEMIVENESSIVNINRNQTRINYE